MGWGWRAVFDPGVRNKHLSLRNGNSTDATAWEAEAISLDYRERLLENKKMSWWEGPAVKSSGFSFNGLEFSSKHSHGSSQLPIIPVPENSRLCSGLWAPGTLMVHRYTCKQNTLVHKIKIKKLKLKSTKQDRKVRRTWRHSLVVVLAQDAQGPAVNISATKHTLLGRKQPEGGQQVLGRARDKA